MQLTISQMLIHRGGHLMKGSYLSCKIANKCLNVCRRLEVQSNKDDSLSYHSVLFIVIVC